MPERKILAANKKNSKDVAKQLGNFYRARKGEVDIQVADGPDSSYRVKNQCFLPGKVLVKKKQSSIENLKT